MTIESRASPTWSRRHPNQSGDHAEGTSGSVRFYDLVVFSEKKRVEKLRYMHRNPVKRGLVLEPGQWAWTSFRHYAYQERGIVLVNEAQRAVLRIGKIA